MSEAISPYIAASKGFALKTFTPSAMSFETNEGLRKLKIKVGNVDEYVRAALKYDSIEILHKCLAAEQVDAVALAINNIQKGGGLIVGDQAGIGKGRIAAAVIRFAVMNGYKAIFLTEKATLFSDLYRDLYDIESSDIVPFIFNNSDDAKLTYTDENDKVTLISKLKENPRYDIKNNSVIESLLDERDTLPKGYDFVMTTYSQLNQDKRTKVIMSQVIERLKFKPREKEPPQYKTKFLRNYAKGAVLVMDEAHNASGEGSSTGFFIREIVSTSLGACYLSATYAKRPDNMSTYAIKTSIDEANLYETINVVVDDRQVSVKDYSLLGQVFAKGGVALQEIVASDLAREGEMIRRQRSYEGITVDWKYLDEKKAHHAKIYDSVTEIMRDIIAFQSEFITTDFIKKMDGVVAAMGDSAKETQGTSQGGIQNTPYFNKTYQTISQLLFSIKAVDVAEEAIQLLNQNRKVVIAFRSTMESFISEFGYADGDEVENHDFALVLKKALDGVMKFTTKNGETKEEETHQILIDDLDEEAQEVYKMIDEKIKNALSGISMSPIDVLINTIENTLRPNDKLDGTPSEYYRVRECTGRKGQIKIIDGKAVYRRFRARKKEFFAQFNSGKADVLLINASSATGVSCHASEKFADQRQRFMLIHEPELDINTEVQKRGRINRTGQVNKPGYRYVSSSIPAEKRLFMVLKKKLASLDANTTGNQKANQSQLEIDDFFNKYGETVVYEFLREQGEVAVAISAYLSNVKKKEEKVGDDGIGNGNNDSKDSSGGDGDVEVEKGDLVRKVTNVVSILSTAQQEIFYDTILQKYKDYVDELKRLDEYDLEAEFLDYKAITERSSLFKEGTGGDSVFGSDAFKDDFQCQNLRKPYKKSYIEDEMNNVLKGKTPRAYSNELIKNWKVEYEQYKSEYLAAKTLKVEEAEEEYEIAIERVTKAEQALEKLKKKEAPKEGELEKAEKKLSNALGTKVKKKQDLDYANEVINNMTLQFSLAESKIEDNIGSFLVGKPVIIPEQIDANTVVFTKAVVMGVYRENTMPIPSNYRILFALTNSQKERVINCENSVLYQIKEATAKANQNQGETWVKDIWENWNKQIASASGDTIRMSMITGNLIAGIGEAVSQLSQQRDGTSPRIKIVKFTTIDGEVKAGIELTEKVMDKLGTSVALTHFKKDIIDLTGNNESKVFIKGKDIVEFNAQQGKLYFGTPNSNQYKKYWKNEDIQKNIQRTPQEIAEGSLGQFVLMPPRAMAAQIPIENVENLLRVLTDLGFSAKGGWKQVDIKAKNAKDTEGPKRNLYLLPEKYEGGKYPIKGFDGVEAYPNTNFGVLVYSLPLSSKQRLDLGLIPVFENPQQPYEDWKRISLASPAIKKEFDELLKEVKNFELDVACRKLGTFIQINAHETGNPEFVFGQISATDLGRMAYSDKIEQLPKAFNDIDLRLKIEISKLKIALS